MDELYDVWNSPKQFESVFKQLKNFCSRGTFVPQIPAEFQYYVKLKFSHFNRLISIPSWMWAFIPSYLIKMGSKYAPKKLELLLNQPKGFNFWGTPSPRTPTTTMFYSSAKLNKFQTSNIQCRLFHECGQLNTISYHACCHLFLMCVSNTYQNEWLQVRFFEKFLGRGSVSLSSDLYYVRTTPSSIISDSRPQFGHRPQISIPGLPWNKFPDPP